MIDNDPGTEADRMQEWEEAFADDEVYANDVDDSRKSSEVRARYALAKAAKTGQTIPCGFCARPFTKTSYQQAFCCNKGSHNCKDSYHNVFNPRGFYNR